MKRNTISGLARSYGRNWLVGLLTSLGVVYLALNSFWNVNTSLSVPAEMAYEDAMAEVVRTAHPPKKKRIPPPEKFSTLVEPLDNLSPITEPEPILDTTRISSTATFGPDPVEPAALTPPPRPASSGKEPPLVFVEVMPRFPGCEDLELSRSEKTTCANQKLLAFVMQHLRYPRAALDNGIEGTVVVGFVVEKDGSISEAEVLKDIGGGCGAEALRVIGQMPDWRPGIQQGKKVRVSFKLPIRFQMN